MSQKRKLPFPQIRRYELTLKERLQRGDVIRHYDGRVEVAKMYKDGVFIVFSGFTGLHHVHFAQSDARRIEAHWEGFCEKNDSERKKLKQRLKRR